MPTLTNTTHSPLQNLFPPITYIAPYIETQILKIIKENFRYFCFCNRNINTISSPITILSVYASTSYDFFYVIGKFQCERCNKEYYFFVPLTRPYNNREELQLSNTCTHLLSSATALENLITFTHTHLPTFNITFSQSIHHLLDTYLIYSYYKHLPTFTTKQQHIFSNFITNSYKYSGSTSTSYSIQTLSETLTISEKETTNLIHSIICGYLLSVHLSSTIFILYLLTLTPTHNTQFKPLTSLVSLDTFHI